MADPAVDIVPGLREGVLDRGLHDYLAHLRVEYGLSPHTLSTCGHDLGYYLCYLRSADISAPQDVSHSDVVDFLEALRTGSDGARPLASSSASRTVMTVHGWHKFLLAEGTASGGPSATVRPPQPGRRLPRALGVDKVCRLLEVAGVDDSPVGLRDRALLEVLYATGARISEAVGLVTDDFDADSRPLRLLGKERKEHVIPVEAYVWETLDAYLVRGRPALAEKGRGVLQIFPSTLGRPLNWQSAWAAPQQAVEWAGLIGTDDAGERCIPLHTLRHSPTTHLLAREAGVRVVQEMFGHASVATTRIYTKVTVDHLREVYATSHSRALVWSMSPRMRVVPQTLMGETWMRTGPHLKVGSRWP